MNTADQGTKFKTYDEIGPNNKILRAEDCGPSSAHYLRLPWMTQIQKTIDEGVIISARDLSSKGTLGSLTSDDKVLFDGGFRRATAALRLRYLLLACTILRDLSEQALGV